MRVETRQLLIRDFEADDLGSILEWRSDPDVYRYMDIREVSAEEESRDFLAASIRYNAEVPRESHNCAIVVRATEEIAGWIGIGGASKEKREFGDLDFGYALAKAHWGNGYATEALGAVLDFAFAEMDVVTIFGECRLENVGSARVMEKAGMTPMGPTPWDEKSLWFQVRRK